MQASNEQIISVETQKRLYRDHIVSKKQRRTIRIQGIQELLEQNSPNKEYSGRELISAAGYRYEQYGTGWAFINKLIEKGVLVKYPMAGTSKARYVFVGEKSSRKKKHVVYDTVPSTETQVAEPTGKAEEVVTIQDDCSLYTLHFTLDKKPEPGAEYGAQRIAHLEMSNLTVDQIREMVGEILNRTS